jgi:hypothetical protein
VIEHLGGNPVVFSAHQTVGYALLLKTTSIFASSRLASMIDDRLQVGAS